MKFGLSWALVVTILHGNIMEGTGDLCVCMCVCVWRRPARGGAQQGLSNYGCPECRRGTWFNLRAIDNLKQFIDVTRRRRLTFIFCLCLNNSP